MTIVDSCNYGRKDEKSIPLNINEPHNPTLLPVTTVNSKNEQQIILWQFQNLMLSWRNPLELKYFY